MTFRDLSIESEYRTTDNDLITRFYKPVLSQTVLYRRVSAYFSLAGLSLASAGLDQLLNNGGRCKFVFSQDISEQDFDRIHAGYHYRDLIEKRLLDSGLNDEELKQQLGILAFMIAENRADVKVAFMRKADGIFHDKFGLFTDGVGNRIFFNGSANESLGGLQSNYESISVDIDWDMSSRVQKRIEENDNRFERIWHDDEVGLHVVSANSIVYEYIKDFQKYVDFPKETKIMQQKMTMLPDDFSGWAVELKDGKILFEDKTKEQLSERNRHLRIDGDWTGKYFQHHSHFLKEDLVYSLVDKFIKQLSHEADKRNVSLYVDSEILENNAEERYSIEKYKDLGFSLKNNSPQFNDEFRAFAQVVSESVERPLKPLHMKAAFYMYKLAKAANFSVPGAGKTAMILGVFAYLNSNKTANEEFANRILVISPINAFGSWQEEFKKTFGAKKKIKHLINVQAPQFDGDLRRNWTVSNLVLVNYESLVKYKEQLEELVDADTLVVFDEVHRIKGINGVRAKAASHICDKAKFRFVLTGTPIPNSYRDIYNFLHILYTKEYDAFFGWGVPALSNPNAYMVQQINEKMYPFFWRTNKEDLGVPPADPDIFRVAEASDEQLDLALSIWSNEKSSLAKLIRLMQVSTNPALLNKKIDYSSFGFDDDEDTETEMAKKDFAIALDAQDSDSPIKGVKQYSDFDLSHMISPKFETGIATVEQLVSEGKKVVVWGLFVDTLRKIYDRLSSDGISSALVYGQTPVDKRGDQLSRFMDKKSNINVLISNPQTLGESISLQSVVHDAVYFEFNFNLTFMLQSRDRIHRLGLPDNQYTRYYICETHNNPSEYGFIDHKIYTRLKRKEKVMRDAIDGDVLKPEISDDLLAEVREIIDSERRRIVELQKDRISKNF
ncbi:SNF2-related protein [Bifidobacterium sp. ESL0775]|uniref:SNF2-related protein n=1 Tax=Bifidobacterium sp. ESL0775 TaxID=2983230 RepID=UPI0023F82F3E|nr:SNF2-related protein [Bifidobacterium sp. ESL0775]WEV69713.1 SNF2-related protein [Bifidobacterium sp. ESL0775]